MQEDKKGYLYVVANTKGGVGKSTIASQVMAPYLNVKHGEKVVITSADDNNKYDESLSESDILEVKTYGLTDGIDNAEDLLYDVVQDNKSYILDVEGGNGSAEAIKSICSLELDDHIVFVIPFFSDKSGIKNMKDTMKAIREHTEESKILLVANKVQNINNIENEFLYFYGDEDLEIKGILPELEADKNIALTPILSTNVFDLASESSKTAFEIGEWKVDIDQYLKDQMAVSKEDYKKAKAFAKIFNQCKQYNQDVLAEVFKDIDKLIGFSND